MTPISTEAVAAIQQGDVVRLKGLLLDRPELVHERVDGQRSLLHIATDWPGHFPRVGESIAALVDLGADVNSRFVGPHTETPLHWAASSNDLEAMDALLASGADLEADGGVIGGGTPLADAVAFGQWKAAQRLLTAGARTTLWQAAALGLLDRVEEMLGGGGVSQAGLTNAFWCACHGGQKRTAECLLARGADPNWVGYDRLTPLGAAERGKHEDVAAWLRSQGAKSTSKLSAG